MGSDPDYQWLIRDRYGPLVGMLTLQVGRRDVAEELAQDAMVKLIRHWDRVQVMDNPSAWLTAVAFNHARSWWRHRAAEQRARRRHGPTGSTADAPDTETVMVVRAAVRDLPARQRQAIILRYFDSCSVAETAEIMDCAEGTVKALTSQARATLRKRDLRGVSLSPPSEQVDNRPDRSGMSRRTVPTPKPTPNETSPTPEQELP